MDWSEVKCFLSPEKICFRQKRQEAMVWLLLSVIVSLLPLLSNYIFKSLERPYDIDEFLCHVSCNGEIFLLTVGMLAAATGRLLLVSTRKKIWKNFVLAVCFISMLFAGYTYGQIPDEKLNTNQLSQLALIARNIYAAGFLFSVLCFAFTDQELKGLEESRIKDGEE